MREGLWRSQMLEHSYTSVEAIADAIIRELNGDIVLGLPLNMDDSIGPAARGVIAWGNNFAERAQRPVIYVDERLSSFSAEQDLNDRKRGGERLTRKRRKEQLDALAAAGFLQAFLDGKLAALNV